MTKCTEKPNKIRFYRLIDQTSGCEVASHVIRADSPISRGIGLLCRTTLAQDEGIWLTKTKSIHTFGMQFVIDVLFINTNLRCIDIINRVRPWRVAIGPSETAHTIELKHNIKTAQQVNIGDQMAFIPVED